MIIIIKKKYFKQIGKIQELKAELKSEKKDPKFTRKKNVLKKIVANMTMGNDMSPLFPDVLVCMDIPVLEIKKMVYLYLIHYAGNKPEMILMSLKSFTKVNLKKNISILFCFVFCFFV